jgi:hypothetical protein
MNGVLQGALATMKSGAISQVEIALWPIGKEIVAADAVPFSRSFPAER